MFNTTLKRRCVKKGKRIIKATVASWKRCVGPVLMSYQSAHRRWPCGHGGQGFGHYSASSDVFEFEGGAFITGSTK